MLHLLLLIKDLVQTSIRNAVILNTSMITGRDLPIVRSTVNGCLNGIIKTTLTLPLTFIDRNTFLFILLPLI